MEPAREALAMMRAGKFMVTAALITGVTMGWVKKPMGLVIGFGTGVMEMPNRLAISGIGKLVEAPVSTPISEEMTPVEGGLGVP